MKQRFVSTVALAFAISSVTAVAAQDRTSNGNTTGTAVPRGGDGGGSATPRGGDSGSSSPSGSSSSGSSGSMGSPSTGSSSSTPSTWTSFEAPRRSNDQAQGRSRDGGTSTGERAVPRGGSGESGTRGSGSTVSTASSTSSGEAPSRRAVPAYSRPRDGRPVTGVAVDRGSVSPPNGGGGGVIYYPYYPWGFWGPGYSYGLGYLFYDPWYGGGYGYGYPYGGYGYGGYGYGGYGGGGGYQVSDSYKEAGKLRLKIDPKQAEVYVDGYYVGIVDSFDGAFQKLELDSGGHRIDLKADGFEPLQFEVLITPGETVTYKGDMKKIR
jgi:PEGA domain